MRREKKVKEKWYYDACTLDDDIDIYDEIINKNKQFHRGSLVSHLSLGEAYGNCHNKDELMADAFIDLIKSLGDRIQIIGNDSIEKQFKKVKSKFTKLSITDAMHLATALKHLCSVFRTIDPDLYKLPHKKVAELGTECGMPRFCVSKIGTKT